MELSEEVYCSREWTLSSQTTQHVDNRALVETRYQLLKGDEILASQPALRGPVAGGAAVAALEEVLSDFDTVLTRSGASRPTTAT